MMVKLGRPEMHFSVYVGDKLIARGTARECAKQMGIKYLSFHQMRYRYLVGERTKYRYVEELEMQDGKE